MAKIMKIIENCCLTDLHYFGFDITSDASGLFKKVFLEDDEDNKIKYYIDSETRIIEIIRLDGNRLDDTLFNLIDHEYVEIVDNE